MAFHEIRFPDDISYGLVGGPGFKTTVLEMDSGQEQRIARWATERHRYNAAYAIKALDTLGTLIDFYMAVGSGSKDGFRFKDWLDFSSASNHRDAPDDSDILIGEGNGSETVFQLKKFYTYGSQQRTRIINKPVSGSTVVAVDGVGQGSGWTVNLTNGELTFTTPPTDTHPITVGFEFDVPVRFGLELDDLLSISYDNFDDGSAPSISLIELKNEDEYPGDFFYGGAVALSLTANYSMSPSEARVIVATPDAASRLLKLPVWTNLPVGGPYFYIKNGSGTYTLLLRYTDGSSVYDISPGETVTVCLVLTSGGAKDWLVFS